MGLGFRGFFVFFFPFFVLINADQILNFDLIINQSLYGSFLIFLIIMYIEFSKANNLPR